MPSRNTRKVYVNKSYYHVYNRGVEKRIIFSDPMDYKVFLNYIKEYLSQPSKQEDLKTPFTLKGETFKGVKRQPRNYFGKVELLAYCLMPNHVHFVLKQNGSSDMKCFIQSLFTRYSMYFNKKYERVGGLFQGPYKAVMITDDVYLLHLTIFIHLNPSEYIQDITSAYSSYAEYLGLRKTEWVKPDFILKYFNNSVIKELKKFNNYKSFVEGNNQDPFEILGKLTLE